MLGKCLLIQDANALWLPWGGCKKLTEKVATELGECRTAHCDLNYLWIWLALGSLTSSGVRVSDGFTKSERKRCLVNPLRDESRWSWVWTSKTFTASLWAMQSACGLTLNARMQCCRWRQKVVGNAKTDFECVSLTSPFSSSSIEVECNFILCIWTIEIENNYTAFQTL